MNKKIKKMMNNPSLFFKDMWKKRVLGVQTSLPKKYNCRVSYNIVIVGNDTTTNIEGCLNSIYAQRVDLNKNINIIFLDLGINTASREKLNEFDIAVIEPHTSSLVDFRNLLSGKYTSFIWADDFIDVNFILNTDKFIFSNRARDFGIILSNPHKGLAYNEIAREYHPLRALYKKVPPLGFPPAQLIVDSIYGTFIPTSILLLSLKDHEGYEWLHFDALEVLIKVVNSLLDRKVVGFSKTSKYISFEHTISAPFKGVEWTNNDLFGHRFSFIVKLAEQNIFIKNKWDPCTRKTLLYFILKFIRKGLSNQSLLDVCDDKGKTLFINELKRAISILGVDTINTFNFASSELIKAGCAKWVGEYRFNKLIEVIQYDSDKDLGLLRYYTSEPRFERFILNKSDTMPFIDKTIEHRLFSQPFSYERRVWLPLKTEVSSSLICFVDNERCSIRGLDKKIALSINTIDTKRYHQISLPYFKVKSIYDGAWIFMDRDNQADDNAEHLYRYVISNRPDIDAYFVLNSDSHDWERLSTEGFKILAFGSQEHEAALESCSRVISSHAAQFATDYFKDKRMLSKKFIFLQHGVIHNDQSSLFKPDWKRFDLFLTSAYGEYESIGGEFSTYKFTSKEVKLTGLPRHDALIKSNISREKMILIMPTWRPSLLGKVISGTERELLPDFSDSQYAKAWIGIINNETLREKARQAGYKIVFFPHANIQPYLQEFNVPDDVEILDHAFGSIQELFLKASMMITDYSSVAFEMAYLFKPVCYYQFDEEDFFTKGHYNKGYFDYRDNGFGPVYNDEQSVIEYALKNIAQDCQPGPEYIEKVNAFFPYRDGNCCQRVLEEIENLDRPISSNYIVDKLLHAAGSAYQEGAWSLAISRYEQYFKKNNLSTTNKTTLDTAKFKYINSLQITGELTEAEQVLNNSKDIDKDLFKSIVIKGRLYSDVLKNQSSVLSENKFLSMYKNDYMFFLNIFGTIYKNVVKKDEPVSGLIDEKFEHFISLCSVDPSSALDLYQYNQSHYRFSLFSPQFIELTLLHAAGRYHDVLSSYTAMNRANKGDILNKLIYLRALRELNQWARMQKFIGSNRILQGRTGIVEFASNYFYIANYDKKPISKIGDYEYIFESAGPFSLKLTQNIIKYFLIIAKDIESAGKLIELYIDDIDPRLVSIYIRNLVRLRQPEKAYQFLKRMDSSLLSNELNSLFGHLAFIYGDYEIFEICFQKIVLDKWPSVDRKANYYLQKARILQQARVGKIQLSVQENIDMTKI
ncbi:CDP-glycerol glycerophosphotransferase family protein [Aeromonas salmonicida]|uniref:CDP-glycerol glycerophosphotransferase family protein n=1 Tax=Aeromonas salmonicida TaxID=645 RepID=UPI00224049FB|nr:CDP-glycerol glycerophosphotransferase family protein [Aeromonas salmonicida]